MAMGAIFVAMILFVLMPLAIKFTEYIFSEIPLEIAMIKRGSPLDAFCTGFRII